ncbi:MAG: AMP-dependent synthetase, partial [Acidimicrobiales bacterium]
VVEGRLGDVIVTGGEKVWPSAVEAALRGYPGVSAVAVIGRPDAEWGQRVVAVVVPADPGTPPTLPEVRAWVRDRLPTWAAPKDLELASELPVTVLGKLRRAALRRSRA